MNIISKTNMWVNHKYDKSKELCVVQGSCLYAQSFCDRYYGIGSAVFTGIDILQEKRYSKNRINK